MHVNGLPFDAAYQSLERRRILADINWDMYAGLTSNFEEAKASRDMLSVQK